MTQENDKPLALRTWSLNGGVIRIQLTRIADFSDADAIHLAIHAFTRTLAGLDAPAGPPLLDALERVVAQFEACGRWEHDYYEGMAELDRARAVIAAAKTSA